MKPPNTILFPLYYRKASPQHYMHNPSYMRKQSPPHEVESSNKTFLGDARTALKGISGNIPSR